MTSREKRELVSQYVSAYNAFDVDGMMATLHPDIVFENVSEGAVNASARGADAFRRLAEQSAALFASRRQTVTHFEDTADGVRIEVDYHAVLAADLPNGLKAGETIQLEGQSAFAFADGLIARLTDYS